MSFFSTRGGACVTASQAILYGLADNSGLYVPAMFPYISRENMVEMTGMDYQARAVEILKYFLEDFSLREIEAAVAAAYGEGKFDDAKIAPLRMLDQRTAVLELFHGPTLAFKDMALQLLPYLTTLSAKKNAEEREIAILVATSGDTGKAALEGFKDVPGTSCTVFYPKDGVSRVQELQMTTTGGGNTHVISVNGNFDDAQTGVKELFASEDFINKMNALGKRLSSANSINFGRLAPQIVYYFSAYADLLGSRQIAMGDKINFVVPTGNFGNILAAYYAKKMGLPIGRLICASNHNNVLTDFFNTGVYSTHRTFMKTTSPSMDILVSSNLERLLFELCERDGELVSVWMNLLKESGSYSIGAQRLEEVQKHFAAGFANNRETAMHIKHVYERYDYVMDPHTAVAGYVLDRYREETGDNTLCVIVSTASPYKFSSDVLEALQVEHTEANAAQKLMALTGIGIPKQVAELDTLPVHHTASCEKEGMAEAVLKEF